MKKKATKKIKGTATITIEPFGDKPRELNDIEKELVKWLFK